MTSAHVAWERMRRLARVLRARQPIPDDLADFIADAIEAVEGKSLPDARMAKAFTDELELTALNCRKLELTPAEAQIERDFIVPGAEYPSQTKAATYISKHISVDVGGDKVKRVSKSTAINRLREADEAQRKEIEELQHHDGGGM